MYIEKYDGTQSEVWRESKKKLMQYPRLFE